MSQLEAEERGKVMSDFSGYRVSMEPCHQDRKLPYIKDIAPKPAPRPLAKGRKSPWFSTL